MEFKSESWKDEHPWKSPRASHSGNGFDTTAVDPNSCHDREKVPSESSKFSIGNLNEVVPSASSGSVLRNSLGGNAFCDADVR